MSFQRGIVLLRARYSEPYHGDDVELEAQGGQERRSR